MRRTTAAVAGTLAGTALLTLLKLGTGSAASTGVAADGNLPPGAAAEQGQQADPGAAADPSASSTPTKRRRARTAATPGATSPAAGNPANPGTKTRKPGTGTGTGTGTGGAAKTPAKPSGTFAGAPSTNQYGTVRVTVTVSAGRLTNVVASYPTSPSRTAQINARAIPTLRAEALRAQSASIATVSGATYTSSSYRASLASALAAARR